MTLSFRLIPFEACVKMESAYPPQMALFTGIDMSELIVSSLSDHVLEITINRADRKNAITGAMYHALANALVDAKTRDDVHVVLLTGKDGVFSAGNDIQDFVAAPPITHDAPVWEYFRALMELDKPLVAAVDGVAIGIGTTTLLHCDLVYATDRSNFALPFASLGLTPEGASTILLPLLIGRQRAAELLLLGERISAARACTLGIVNEVVTGDALHEVSSARARSLAALPPEVIRKTKRLMQDGMELLVTRQFVAEQDAMRETVRGVAAQQAFARFLNKRK